MSLEQIDAARTKFLEHGMSHGELLAFFTAARAEIDRLLTLTSEQATEIERLEAECVKWKSQRDIAGQQCREAAEATLESLASEKQLFAEIERQATEIVGKDALLGKAESIMILARGYLAGGDALTRGICDQFLAVLSELQLKKTP